jgi:predicted nuclease with TOPRIM domain
LHVLLTSILFYRSKVDEIKTPQIVSEDLLESLEKVKSLEEEIRSIREELSFKNDQLDTWKRKYLDLEQKLYDLVLNNVV